MMKSLLQDLLFDLFSVKHTEMRARTEVAVAMVTATEIEIW